MTANHHTPRPADSSSSRVSRTRRRKGRSNGRLAPGNAGSGSWQRIALGILSATMLAAGGILSFLPGVDDEAREFFSGTLLKVGVVLFIGWLAAPQLERFGWERLRGTLLLALLVVAVLLAIRPKFGAIAAGVLVVLSVGSSVLTWMRRLKGS